MRLLKTIKLNKTTGKLNPKDIFQGYLSSEFPVVFKSAPALKVEINELTEDTTFKDMFKDPENQALTPSQITEFCKNHKADLRQEGYATFFLFKENGGFFVAGVSVRGDGHLDVGVYSLGLDVVWRAFCQHRIVVPQLPLKNLKKVTLSDLESLTLRIEKLEKLFNPNLLF